MNRRGNEPPIMTDDPLPCIAQAPALTNSLQAHPYPRQDPLTSIGTNSSMPCQVYTLSEATVKTATLMITLFAASIATAQAPKHEFGLNLHKITVDGLERTYRLVVPPNAPKPMPLVMVLHGGGFGERGARHVIGYTQFTRIALREKFIVVYPMGIDGNWNDGREAESIRAHREDVDDVKFLRAVVNEVASKYTTDQARVFSTGISNGGFMSHRLAAEASDLVAGIAPVAGGMSPLLAKRFDPDHPVSVFIIQGDADPMIPIAGGIVGRRNRETRGSTISTESIVELYKKQNRHSGKPKMATLPNVAPEDETTTQRWTYPRGRGGVKLQVDIIKNGGHTWPGKKPYMTERLIGKTSRDYDATEAIWEFFKSCPPR